MLEDEALPGSHVRVAPLRVAGPHGPVAGGPYVVVSFALPSSVSATDTGLTGLTAAEREVVQALVDGMSRREIAARRGRALGTVARQLESAYRKLGVSSRTELAARLSPSAPGP